MQRHSRLAEAFGGEVPKLVLDEVCGWHQAISWVRDDPVCCVLDVSHCDSCDEVSRIPVGGRTERVHRRLPIRRGFHDVLEHCRDCWLHCMHMRKPDIDYLGGVDNEEDFDDISSHCHDDGYCGFFGLHNVTGWGPWWLDLWTEEYHDCRGNLVVLSVDSEVDNWRGHRHWCCVDDEESYPIGDALYEKGAFNYTIVSHDYEQWDRFMDHRKDTLSDWWYGSDERRIAEEEWRSEARRRVELKRRRDRRDRRVQHRDAVLVQRAAKVEEERWRREDRRRRRIEHRRAIRDGLMRRFGVPWDVHRLLLKLDLREWDEEWEE